MAFAVYQDIVRLQVSVNNVLFVQRLNSEEDLRDVQLSFVLSKPFLNFEVLAQIPATGVVANQKQSIRGLKCVKQLRDERMRAHRCHYVALCEGVHL